MDPQPLQDGVPQARVTLAAGGGGKAVGPGEIRGEILDGQVSEFDAGGPHQRCVNLADRLGVLVPAAGQDQR